jgi:hypothetical protein
MNRKQACRGPTIIGSCEGHAAEDVAVARWATVEEVSCSIHQVRARRMAEEAYQRALSFVWGVRPIFDECLASISIRRGASFALS